MPAETSLNDALVDIALQALFFLSSAPEEVLEEEAAVRELEAIAHTLRSRLSPSEKKAFLGAVSQRLERARQDPRGANARAWEHFLTHLPSELGLEE